MKAHGDESVRTVEAYSGPELEQARTLIREYRDGLGVDIEYQGFEAELVGLPGVYARPRGRLRLALAGGAPAGCVAIRPLSETVCEMKRLFVRPGFRGLSVGLVLCRHIIRDAREIGYKAMRLDTLASMGAARKLYASLGFRTIQPYCFNPLEGAEFMELGLGGKPEHANAP